MRRLERIPIILKFLRENNGILENFVRTNEHIFLSKDFEDYWLKNYDFRLGQALINFEYLEDDRNGVWEEDEVDWLIENKYLKFEELTFWGRGYDKDMNPIPLEWIVLKDLELDHIKNIIKYFKENNRLIRSDYLKYFKKRIKNDK